VGVLGVPRDIAFITQNRIESSTTDSSLTLPAWTSSEDYLDTGSLKRYITLKSTKTSVPTSQ
jgi:hypothetical protein